MPGTHRFLLERLFPFVFSLDHDLFGRFKLSLDDNEYELGLIPLLHHVLPPLELFLVQIELQLDEL